MADLALSPLNYDLRGYGLPSLRTRNVYVSGTPAGPGPEGRFPRPGLVETFVMGNGPVWGQFRQAGTFGGDLFAVVGDGFYRNTRRIADVAAGQVARFAASDNELVFCVGGVAYLYNGQPQQTVPIFKPATALEIAMPDGQRVRDVAYLGGRFVFLIEASDRFYWSEINDAATIAGNSYATAEGSPDATVGMEVVGDELWFFGLESTEPWRQSTNIDLPFAKSGGRTRRGCAAQLSIVAMGGTVAWLADDRTVWTREGKISSHSEERALQRCAQISAVTALQAVSEGHVWYVLNIPGVGSLAYDFAAPGSGWIEWASRDLTTFRGRNSVLHDGETFIGDEHEGIVWRLDDAALTDGGELIECIVSAVIPVRQPFSLNNLTLRPTLGAGTATGGADEVEPAVEMRLSTDQARTWTDWEAESFGVGGDYDKLVRWHNLGLMESPATVIEFRSTSPTVRSFAGVGYNDTAEPRA